LILTIIDKDHLTVTGKKAATSAQNDDFIDGWQARVRTRQR